jgi:hypothetical protein
MSVLSHQFFKPSYAPRRRSAWAAPPVKRKPFAMTRAGKRLKASSISRKEAQRAIYIDFEGLIGQAPTLIGILVGRRFEQVVLDPWLHESAVKVGCRVATLKEEVSRVMKVARKERRLVVAFSDHERNKILEYCNRDIASRYRNARKIADRWNESRPITQRAKGQSLKHYMDSIGYRRSQQVKACSPAREIRAIKRASESLKGNTLQSIRGRWRILLKYNEHDCRGMKDVVTKAATPPHRARQRNRSNTN